MSTTTFAPSTLIDSFPIQIGQITDAMDVTSPDGGFIDCAHYSFLHVVLYAGNGNTNMNLFEVIENDSNLRAGAVAVSGASLVHVQTDDNTLQQLEIRLHGRKRYIGFHLTGLAGAGTPYSLVAFGVKGRSSNNASQLYPTPTPIAQLTLTNT